MTINLQNSLFSSLEQNSKEPLKIKLDQNSATPSIPGSVFLYEQCFTGAESKDILKALIENLNWQQPSIRMHGRELLIPRKQVWMGDPETSYRYSGKLFSPEPWTTSIVTVKKRIESLIGQQYNSVLCNLYRDGQDSVAWHADDEPELDLSTPIASISFGASRRFDLRPKIGKQQSTQLTLEDGMLLVMTPEVQTHWLHQIPKTKKVHSPRVNLTFRRVKTS